MRSIDNTVSLKSHITEINENKYVAIDIISPEFTVPSNEDGSPYVSGIDFLLIIDKSGSMGAWAPTKDSSGNLEDSEYSVMDIVIHAVKQVLLVALKVVCIVTYDVDAYVNEFRPMDLTGKVWTK